MTSPAKLPAWAPWDSAEEAITSLRAQLRNAQQDLRDMEKAAQERYDLGRREGARRAEATITQLEATVAAFRRTAP